MRGNAWREGCGPGGMPGEAGPSWCTCQGCELRYLSCEGHPRRVWARSLPAADRGLCAALCAAGPSEVRRSLFLEMQSVSPLVLSLRCCRSYKTGPVSEDASRVIEATCLNTVGLLSILGEVASRGDRRRGGRTELRGEWAPAAKKLIQEDRGRRRVLGTRAFLDLLNACCGVSNRGFGDRLLA